jgi:hypothetical protein
MGKSLPEKAALLKRLEDGDFNVPDFCYVSAHDFHNENFGRLEKFLKRHRESFKVITRSAHPLEQYFKAGTFDSLETYADLAGIIYARKKIIKLSQTAKQLSIKRQIRFNRAPLIDPEDMGVIVMPYVNGASVMAKMMGDSWEFGYCRDRCQKLQSEPYITRTPHDVRLLRLSQDIQDYLGFRCELEYVISEDGGIHVVQAKDISHMEMPAHDKVKRSIQLDGIRRTRRHRNYRERILYVLNNRDFYLRVIEICEGIVMGAEKDKSSLEDVLTIIREYQTELEEFAMKHQFFAVLGLWIQDPEELYQIANHYLDDFPEMQPKISEALHDNLYRIDYFLSETDTLIAKDKFRLNLCGHDAYGIDTVRNPMWSVYWRADKHDQVVQEFMQLGFKTGDTVGIEIDSDEKPIICRL